MLTPQPRPAPQEARQQKRSRVVSSPTGAGEEGGTLARACKMYRKAKRQDKRPPRSAPLAKAKHKVHKIPGVLIGTPGLWEGDHSLGKHAKLRRAAGQNKQII